MLETFPGWNSLEKLGEGGMCAVYRVRPLGGGPERAIKVLYDRSDSAVERFIAEGSLLQGIDHRNIVKVHDLHPDARPPWLVMDLLAGRDLEETRTEQGPMDPEVAARHYADVANGLALVHKLGILHRDIKPANIMLGHDGVPRLIDFGIARDPKAARLTGKGLVMGTAAYLPPEVFDSDDPNRAQESEAADVYALGQSLCESLTGAPVFDLDALGGNALLAIMREKLEAASLDPRRWRPGVPSALADIVQHATRREPDERLQTAAELEALLRRFLSARQTAGQAAPVSRSAVLPPPPRPSAPPPAAPASVSTPSPSAPRLSTPAPAPDRATSSGPGAGTAAAASFASLGLVSAFWVIAFVAGAAGLWAFAPTATAVDAAAYRAAVAAQSTRLRACKPRARAEIDLSWTVIDGRVSGVHASATGKGKKDADDCVVRALQEVRFPSHPTPVSLQMRIAYQ